MTARFPPGYAGVPTDYAVWADFWDLMETHGLNARAIPVLAPFLRAPVLLVGSGQGLVARSLEHAGYAVVSVDSSPAMARHALERRGVRTLVCDAVDLRMDRTFGTVLVSTGVVNERTLQRRIVPRLAASLRPLLRPGAHLLLSYFRRSAWTGVAHLLGLYGRPSANELFWAAGGDLDRAERLFAVRTGHRAAVHRTFQRHHDALARHSRFVVDVGRRCAELGVTSPEAFLREHSGFYPYPLTAHAEAALTRGLHAAGLTSRSRLVLEGADTRVVAARAEP